jgi:hypothetical protein
MGGGGGEQHRPSTAKYKWNIYDFLHEKWVCQFWPSECIHRVDLNPNLNCYAFSQTPKHVEYY